MISKLSHIAALVDGGGEITLRHVDVLGKCVASASDDDQCLAMLVRRKGEKLDALLQRLDAAIADAYDNQHFADEVNTPTASGSKRRR